MDNWTMLVVNWTNLTLNDGMIRGIPDHLVDPTMLLFRDVIHGIDLYGIPVISIVGILGNALCGMVFMATYLRRMSSSVYLAALSVCDTLFLLTTLLSWMDNVNVDVYHRQVWCQLLTYVGYVTSFLDVWFVVSFTVERYVAVCFPFQQQIMCTTRRARIVVISLAAIGMVLFNYALWTTEVGWYYDRPFCSPKPKYFKLVMGLSNVDTLITLVIPTVLIIMCNIRIGYAVAKFYRCRVNLTQSGIVVDVNENTSGSTSGHMHSSYNRLQMKVTKMLLLVSSVFLVCHLPSHGCRVYAFIMSLAVPGYTPSHKMILVQKLFQYVYIMNFGLNFFLYSLSGKTFRRALVRFVRSTTIRMGRFVSSRYSLIRTRSRSRSRGKTHVEIMMNEVTPERKLCSHNVNINTCKVCDKYS